MCANGQTATMIGAPKSEAANQIPLLPIVVFSAGTWSAPKGNSVWFPNATGGADEYSEIVDANSCPAHCGPDGHRRSSQVLRPA